MLHSLNLVDQYSFTIFIGMFRSVKQSYYTFLGYFDIFNHHLQRLLSVFVQNLKLSIIIGDSAGSSKAVSTDEFHSFFSTNIR